MKESCLIIAGEKSGEEHAMSFLPELMQHLDFNYYGVGGEDLKKQGVELLYHLQDFSSWGISNVIKKIPFYKKALTNIINEVASRKTKYAILVDFQTFNLKLAQSLSKQGVTIFYYVAPQAWVWKKWRARVIGDFVEVLFTIIPFEKKWFQKQGCRKVVSVEHPLKRTFQKELEGFSPPKKESMKEWNICVLPGSRDFEVQELLPLFCETLSELKEEYVLKTSIVVSDSYNNSLISQYLPFFDRVYESNEIALALSDSHLALAASGTVTLTCGLFQVPTVVCYRSSLLNYYLFENYIDYKGFVALNNLVHEEEIFPECIQDRATKYNIIKSLKVWMSDPSAYEMVRAKLSRTREKISGEISNVGEYIASYIKERA